MDTLPCRRCNTPLDPHVRYCAHCGTRVLPAGQRSDPQQQRFIVYLCITAVLSWVVGVMSYPAVLPLLPGQAALPIAPVAPGATATATPSAQYLALNIKTYPGFTIYLKPELWQQAVGTPGIVEDFSRDTADYGELSFPYLTGNGLLLDGNTSAQIIADRTSPGTGTRLHFRDWKGGLQMHFPNDTPVRAFGFEYQSNEVWQVHVAGQTIPLSEGRSGFFGIVFRSDYPSAMVLSSNQPAQGGLSVDNIVFVPET